jgi:hypothetical protein
VESRFLVQAFAPKVFGQELAIVERFGVME